MIKTAPATTVTLAGAMNNASADYQQDHQQKHEELLQNTIDLVELRSIDKCIKILRSITYSIRRLDKSIRIRGSLANGHQKTQKHSKECRLIKRIENGLRNNQELGEKIKIIWSIINSITADKEYRKAYQNNR
jgi:hypothetical protein